MKTSLIPHEWQGRTLADLGLCHVVGQLLGRRDRTEGSAAVVVTDAHDHVVAPFVVERVPLQCEAWELEEFCTQLADVASHVARGGGLAVGVGRPGAAVVCEADEAWAAAVALACRQARVTWRGCALATPSGVLLIGDGRAAAA